MAGTVHEVVGVLTSGVVEEGVGGNLLVSAPLRAEHIGKVGDVAAHGESVLATVLLREEDILLVI